MLILKLDLPEAAVSYNRNGVRTSEPVPFTPDSIRSLQLDMTITGYTSPEGFFAFKAESDTQTLTTQEQFSLLARLGFKTIPVQLYPSSQGVVDACIRARTPFLAYNPVWWDTVKDEEFKLPFLATVKKIAWALDNRRRLVMELTTDKGIYEVIDHRRPEYYQVGLQIKIFNGEVQPYMSGGLVEKIPSRCPVCNNPLSKFQFSSDLPLIIKCNHPVCKLMKTTEEPVPSDEEFEELEDQEEQEDVVEPASEEPLTEEELTAAPLDTTRALAVIDLDGQVDPEKYPTLMLITSVQQFELGDFANVADLIGIVVKSRRSVTKVARQLAESTNLPLIPVNELDRALRNARRDN